MANTKNEGTKAVKATSLNVWVLAKIMGGSERASNRVESTSAPHIRRCLGADLIRVEGVEIVLTDAGRAAIVAGK